MPLNIDFQQIFLHLFNFVLLFGILYFLLYKPVKDFMDNRTRYFEKMEEEAKAELAAAQQTREDYEQKLSGVEDEIAGRKKQAADEAEQARRAALQKAENEAAKLVADTRKNLEHERERMLKEAQDEIMDLVSAAAEKLVTESTTSQAFDCFLDTAKRSDPDA